MAVWPAHPQPLPDEVLSSWMIRVARRNGFRVQSFTAAVFGRDRPVWTRDVDHHAPLWLLEGLSSGTGVPIDIVEAMTLRAFEGYAFEVLNPAGHTQWLMPLGVRHRQRHAFGQQFCAACMATDAQPYLRKRWRLAFVTCCITHGALLNDRCPQCLRPLMMHREDIGKPLEWSRGRKAPRCSCCGFNFDAVNLYAAPKKALQMQTTFERALRQGWIEVGGQPVYSHIYFKGLFALVRGMDRIHGRPATVLEADSVLGRQRRIARAYELTRDWPDALLRIGATIRRPYTTFTRDLEELPYWLQSVLRRNLAIVVAPMSNMEVLAICHFQKTTAPVDWA